MRGSSREVNEFLQAPESCLLAASKGQSCIITKDGEEYVAVISMSEYEQLQYLKSLLEKAGLELLQDRSSS